MYPSGILGDMRHRNIISDETAAYLAQLQGRGFSGIIQCSRGTDDLYTSASGYANRAKRTPVSRETVFSIGSLTKSFTAAAVLTLQMKGRLHVHDSIAWHLPHAPEDKSTITIHHLLTHSSGLADFVDRDGLAASEYTTELDYEPVSREEIIDRAWHSSLLFEPGARMAYSNLGYSLLGAVIESVSGLSYEEYLRAEVLGPAGMFQTGYALPTWDSRLIAHGYVGAMDWGSPLEKPRNSDGPYWMLRANGCLLSTAVDLQNWWNALKNESVLSSELWNECFRPHVPVAPETGIFYGYGWVVRTAPQDGSHFVLHNGSNGVFSATFRWLKDHDILLAVLSNTSAFSAHEVAKDWANVAFKA